MQEQLLPYIKQNLKKGYAADVIREQLLGAGYSRGDVDEAFAAAAPKQKAAKKPSRPVKAKATKTRAKIAEEPAKEERTAPAKRPAEPDMVRINIPIPPGKIAYHDAPPASVKLRIAAGLLDLIVITAAIMAGGAISLGAMLGASIGVLFMYLILDALIGGGPGLILLDLRIARKDGSPIGLIRAFARHLLKLPSLALLGIGYLMPLWMRSRQTWHDRVTGSYVVRAHHKYV